MPGDLIKTMWARMDIRSRLFNIVAAISFEYVEDTAPSRYHTCTTASISASSSSSSNPDGLIVEQCSHHFNFSHGEKLKHLIQRSWLIYFFDFFIFLMFYDCVSIIFSPKREHFIPVILRFAVFFDCASNVFSINLEHFSQVALRRAYGCSLKI